MPVVKRKRSNVPYGMRKRSKNSNSLYSINHGTSMVRSGAMPQRFKTIMRYHESISVNPGIGGLADNYFYQANGLYDVNITGSGHQPTGFDQIMAFYDHYTVTNARMVASFRNTDGSNRQIVGLAQMDSATSITDVRRLIENGNCIYKVLNVSGVTGDSCELKLDIDIAKFLGRKNLLSDPDCKGTSGANPLEGAFFVVFAGPDSTVDAAIVSVTVTIEFDVYFHERQKTVIS